MRKKVRTLHPMRLRSATPSTNVLVSQMQWSWWSIHVSPNLLNHDQGAKISLLVPSIMMCVMSPFVYMPNTCAMNHWTQVLLENIVEYCPTWRGGPTNLNRSLWCLRQRDYHRSDVMIWSRVVDSKAIRHASHDPTSHTCSNRIMIRSRSWSILLQIDSILIWKDIWTIVPRTHERIPYTWPHCSPSLLRLLMRLCSPSQYLQDHFFDRACIWDVISLMSLISSWDHIFRATVSTHPQKEQCDHRSTYFVMRLSHQHHHHRCRHHLSLREQCALVHFLWHSTLSPFQASSWIWIDRE